MRKSGTLRDREMSSKSVVLRSYALRPMSPQLQTRVVIGVMGLFFGAVAGGLLQTYFLGGATPLGIAVSSISGAVASFVFPRVLAAIMAFIS
jgi:hypothetical protein